MFNVFGVGIYFNFKLDKWIGFVYSFVLRGLGDLENKNFGFGIYNVVLVKGKGCVIVKKFDDFDWKNVLGFGWYNLCGKLMFDGWVFIIVEWFI